LCCLVQSIEYASKKLDGGYGRKRIVEARV